jgi:hypothetical protein
MVAEARNQNQNDFKCSRWVIDEILKAIMKQFYRLQYLTFAD